MGWKKGSGLGAKEDGSKDFIRIRYKNDALGLGFEHRDDQWTQHEQNFSGLLKTLNNEDNNDDSNDKPEENGNESEEETPRVGFGFAPTPAANEVKKPVEKLKEKISGISLEERSKQSRARVHYKKFTKGKDLAQYSEKDLANIFGKKAVDEQQAANDFYQQLNNNFEKKQEETKESDKEEETSNGTYIINTGVSVNDYFKSKMEALKNRANGVNKDEENIEEKGDTSNEVQEEETSKKKKKKKKDKKDQVKEEEQNGEVTPKEQKEENGQMIYSSVSVNDYFKMKMEALKNKKNGLNQAETQEETNKCEELVEDEEVSKKKKKKKKSKEQDNEVEAQQTEQTNIDAEASLETKKKEKKSKKRNAEEEEQKPNEEDSKPKKKKDKTKNEPQEEQEQQTQQVENPNETVLKRKHENNTEQEITEIDLTQEEPRKKKQKKSKSKETTEVIEIVESDQEILKEKKKKKKKSKKEQDTTETSEKVEENSTKTSQTETTTSAPSQKKPAKIKDVSPTAKNVFKGDVNIQELNLDDIQKKYQSFNIYPISSFCAEKFRNINLHNFTGSNLPQIEGYSLGTQLKLDVRIDPKDEERITNLWNCVLNKYIQLKKPKKTYQSYVREVMKARRFRKKQPKLYVKTWKRKNAFQAI